MQGKTTEVSDNQTSLSAVDRPSDGRQSHIISTKAADFAQRLDIVDFKGSNGWLDRFKKRYNVQQYTRCGEANSAPLEDLCPYRIELQNLLATEGGQKYPRFISLTIKLQFFKTKPPRRP